MPSGCTCNAGFSGTVVALRVPPFYNYTCKPLPCPHNSSGTDLPTGCSCNPGYTGSITSIVGKPYYSGQCTAVSCPAYSSGPGLPESCTCDSGLTGTIVPTTSAPFYTGSCVPSWTTPAGLLYTVYELSRPSLIVNVTATPPSVIYSIVSGSLPNGASLNQVTGAISGFAAVASSTTYTFTVRATYGSVFSDRIFSIVSMPMSSRVFSYTGSDQFFTIPAGMHVITAYLWGGAGGGGSGEGYSDPGGAGGFTTGTFSTTNLSPLVIQVGGGGGRTSGAVRPSPAYPSGGLPATRLNYVSGGGGGRSAIFRFNVSTMNAVLIAGGGGGASGHGGSNTGRGSQGGAGGGTTSENGYSSYVVAISNYATQTGTNDPPVIGTPFQQGGQLAGQDAGNGQLFDNGGNNCAGGGGDGWWGGGSGGNGYHEGGGGGSGYVNSAFVTVGSTLSNPSNTNAPYLSVLYPPQTSLSYYSSGVGTGNNNNVGGSGLVVLTF